MAADGERFPRRCRLTRGDDILRVRATGARERTAWFDVRRVATSMAHPRVAIVVPLFGNTAVARNRVKRRLREVVRRELLPTLGPQDLVVRASPPAYAASFDALRTAMRDVAARIS